MISATVEPPPADEQRTAGVRGERYVAHAHAGVGRDRGEVDELDLVGVIGAAEPGNPAHIGGRIGDTVGEHEPAAAVRKEGDVFAARPFEIDDAIADLGDAAGDHAEDIDQAAGAACEQRAAGIDHAAADQQRTAVCQDRAGVDKQPVDLGRAAVRRRFGRRRRQCHCRRWRR